MTVPAPRAGGYASGWCAMHDHGRCAGVYAGTRCGCACHHPADQCPDPAAATAPRPSPASD